MFLAHLWWRCALLTAEIVDFSPGSPLCARVVCVCCYFLSLWVMNQASLKRRHPQSAEAAGAEELGQIWHTSQPMLTLTHNITSQSTEERSQLQMDRSQRPHEHRSVWPKVLSKSWIRSFSGKETCALFHRVVPDFFLKPCKCLKPLVKWNQISIHCLRNKSVML